MNPSPTIAIVGRPNVGKSTLFNRLTGTRQAITTEIPGTTRDRISHKYTCFDYETILIDTGGLEYGKKSDIESDVQSQAEIAIQEADLILFVINSLEELTVDDFAAADILRKSKKPTILVANKCDSLNQENHIFNLFELGFGAPIKISAIHKQGIEELNHEIAKNIKKLGFETNNKKEIEDDDSIKICILGKPNAGKSTLVNSLIGENKIITSDIPGTTRDATDTKMEYQDQKFTLMDTAGLRRRGKIEKGIEKFSSIRSLNSIEKSDIVVVLIDGEKGLTKQDPHIIQFALEAKKGIIIAFNKIDLFKYDEDKKNWITNKIRHKFAFLPWAPIVFISAKNKKNTYKLLEISKEIIKERDKRIKTNILNVFFQKIIQKHQPASTKNKKPKFLYATQVDTNPPYFVLFFKNAANLHFSYSRYLENELRKEFGFTGTAINLKIKSKNMVPEKNNINTK